RDAVPPTTVFAFDCGHPCSEPSLWRTRHPTHPDSPGRLPEPSEPKDWSGDTTRQANGPSPGVPPSPASLLTRVAPGEAPDSASAAGVAEAGGDGCREHPHHGGDQLVAQRRHAHGPAAGDGAQSVADHGARVDPQRRGDALLA